MKASLLVLTGIALGCAAGAVGLGPSRTHSQGRIALPIEQYCTDTGDFNDTES